MPRSLTGQRREGGDVRFAVDIVFQLDALSAVMSFLVTGVGLLIHVFSAGYMRQDDRDDRGLQRFFVYMNLFVSGMLCLVLAADLVLLFAGLEAVGELEVVEPEEVEHGGVQVVDVDRLLGHVPADLIAGAVDLPTPEPAAGQEHAEGEGVVIAPGDGLVALAVFAEGGSSEFGPPHDHGFVEHAPLSQVLEEGRHRLVDASRFAPVIAPHVLVAIPVDAG